MQAASCSRSYMYLILLINTCIYQYNVKGSILPFYLTQIHVLLNTNTCIIQDYDFVCCKIFRY